MGDGTKQNPYTREDVLRLIEENGGTAKGLDLSGKVFKAGINLSGLNLAEIILKEAVFLFRQEDNEREGAHLEGANFWYAELQGAYFSELYKQTKAGNFV